jgi:hypothetical protein
MPGAGPGARGAEGAGPAAALQPLSDVLERVVGGAFGRAAGAGAAGAARWRGELCAHAGALVCAGALRAVMARAPPAARDFVGFLAAAGPAAAAAAARLKARTRRDALRPAPRAPRAACDRAARARAADAAAGGAGPGYRCGRGQGRGRGRGRGRGGGGACGGAAGRVPRRATAGTAHPRARGASRVPLVPRPPRARWRARGRPWRPAVRCGRRRC